MMGDLITTVNGVAGCITLNRPQALNALTYDMCLNIERHLDAWELDDAIKIILIDATGDRAFCAGGDIAEMYATATQGDYDYGRRFWTDEYRLNAKLATSPKPIVSFLNGFTMGGGVGIGCHVAHRIVGESSKIAMPECAIGLVPDVGGSYLLARGPGRVGEYLATTTARMTASDALYVGFADHYIPQDHWDGLKQQLCATGDTTLITAMAQDAGPAPLAALQGEIDAHFAGDSLQSILNSLRHATSVFATQTLEKLQTPSPLAMAAAVELIHRNRNARDIAQALEQEYRYTYRSAENGEFIEGIRALIIDKDKSPKWMYGLDDALAGKVTQMLLPLGKNTLNLTQGT